ncbi:glycoside hydrolase [Dacryopinax primogenitus]|uniref:Alpha-galactosidase n=1 Tax=Dacryopinax primogenitus (strain DJM 731) TaxID=1858805 RepID=M5FRQ9_DACPD|nr:glycoside hydrolase [Dacryopinax primogenitus]EJT98433.1 glycoside hydrolase [Dacryopinax primogenitus]
MGHSYIQVPERDGFSCIGSEVHGIVSLFKVPAPQRLTLQISTTGIYSCSGITTCAGYPGSYGYELIDAQTFTEWGIDYLKYDNCNPPPENVLLENSLGKFQRMADAISAGESQVWLWGASMAQSWRITTDITTSWSSITSIINTASFVTSSSGFYGHNDLDMSRGNGELTYDERKSHFTAWALFKSPLLIGTDLTSISNDDLGILLNQELIAINQDPNVSMSISPFSWGVNPDWSFNASYPAQFYSGPTSNGTVVMLLNTMAQQEAMCFTLTDSPWLKPDIKYIVRDLWSHTNNCTAVGSLSVSVPSHGVSALFFKEAGNSSINTGYPACAIAQNCGVIASGDVDWRHSTSPRPWMVGVLVALLLGALDFL